jgi:putative flippase GtrA
MEKIHQLFHKPVGRYIFVGGSVYVIELVVIIVLQELGIGSLIAVGISFWVGLVISFIMQKLITFRDKRAQRRVLIPQVIAFTLLVLFNFGFTLLVTKLLAPPLPAVLTRTIALGVTTIWNFYLYKSRIFNMRDELIID